MHIVLQKLRPEIRVECAHRWKSRQLASVGSWFKHDKVGNFGGSTGFQREKSQGRYEWQCRPVGVVRNRAF